MSYRLDMDGETRSLVSHISPERKRKIREALREIASNPMEGKPLQEELSGLRSYRIGTLRIIYSVDLIEKAVHIVAIGPRKTIYEETAKERETRR